MPRASATAYATMRAGGEKDELIARARHVLDSLASVEDTANAA
ncbi:hypothetical protein [Labrys sp. LIt4]|nr:hypothetical protein [Labrys sp. LIt4]